MGVELNFKKCDTRSVKSFPRSECLYFYRYNFLTSIINAHLINQVQTVCDGIKLGQVFLIYCSVINYINIFQIDTTPIQPPSTACSGTLFRLTDGTVGWYYCAPSDGPQRQMSMVSKTNIVLMESASISMRAPTLIVRYQAEPILEIVSQCPYGSVSLKPGQCLTIVHETLNWEDAEEYCVQNGGGHLASVDSHRTQMLIDTILINR